MPSKYSPAVTKQRARYPNVKEEFGEDPARWLDHPLTEKPALREMARTRIHSIDEIALAREWIEVECDLPRGPRQKVVSWLNQRITTLKVIGERPDRLKERDGRDVPETEWYVVRDGELLSWDEVDRNAATVSLDSGTGRAVTDGGE